MKQIGEIVFAVVQSTKQVIALEIKGIVGIKTAEGDSAESYQLETVGTGEIQTVAIEDVYNTEPEAHQAALILVNGEVEQATLHLADLVEQRKQVMAIGTEAAMRIVQERLATEQQEVEVVETPEVHANAKSNKRRRRRKAKKAQKES